VDKNLATKCELGFHAVPKEFQTNRVPQIAGVFQYMKNPLIWPKFTEASTPIEQTLIVFDQTYPWNEPRNMPDRPNRASGESQAGLRDLYCFWIDLYLSQIDDAAAAWVDLAKSEYVRLYGQSTTGKKWLTSFFGPNGVATKGEMQLPKTPQVAPKAGKVTRNSKYGAWDDGHAGPWT
jgi:chitinase